MNDAHSIIMVKIRRILEDSTDKFKVFLTPHPFTSFVSSFLSSVKGQLPQID
jgi:hypothetical protein